MHNEQEKHYSIYTGHFDVAGCARYKDISIENIAISQFNMTSLSTARVRISATLNNPAGGKLQLTGMNGIIRIKDKQIAEFSLDSAIVFTPRSISTGEGTISLKISNMSVLFSGVVDLDESLLEQIRMDIDALVKSRGMRHKLKLQDIPAKNLLEL